MVVDICLEHCEIDTDNYLVTLSVSSTQILAQCPLCFTSAQRIRSRYERTLADIPCVSFSLTLALQVCKFFCENSACVRRIFTLADWGSRCSLGKKDRSLGAKIAEHWFSSRRCRRDTSGAPIRHSSLWKYPIESLQTVTLVAIQGAKTAGG